MYVGLASAFGPFLQLSHNLGDTSPANTHPQGSIPPAVTTAQEENTLFSFLGTPCIPGVYRRAIEKSKDHRD